MDGFERGEAGGLRVQRGNDPTWDGALKGFAVGGGTLLTLYTYSWKHEGEAPTVSGGVGGLAAAAGLMGGIGALIGIAVDAHYSDGAADGGARGTQAPVVEEARGGCPIDLVVTITQGAGPSCACHRQGNGTCGSSPS